MAVRDLLQGLSRARSSMSGTSHPLIGMTWPIYVIAENRLASENKRGKL
jgi:hypothetical protein